MKQVNLYTKLSYGCEIKCIAEILDRFSTKDAVYILQIYVPQAMIQAIYKLVFSDAPQFIL
jgi:hypothetical protein